MINFLSSRRFFHELTYKKETRLVFPGAFRHNAPNSSLKA